MNNKAILKALERQRAELLAEIREAKPKTKTASR